MHEMILTAVLIGSFVAIVSAYGMGVKHGVASGRGIAPKSIKNAVKGVVESITSNDDETEDDTMDIIMGYSFDKALESVKREQRGTK